MDRNPRLLVVLALATALAVPAAAFGQAIPRPTSSFSSVPPVPLVPPVVSSSAPEPPRVVEMPRAQTPAGSRTPSSSSSGKSGTAAPRGGSSSSSGDRPRVRVLIARDFWIVGFELNECRHRRAPELVPARAQGSRVGKGDQRPASMYYGNNANVRFFYPGSPFSPWGRWYPWFYGGADTSRTIRGGMACRVTRCGATALGATAYDPYCYGGGYWPCDSYMSVGGGGYSSNDDEDDEEAFGSVRLRVSPAHAKVYVDGTPLVWSTTSTGSAIT